MAESFASVVRLSTGASWNPRPDEPPYLLAEPGCPWPTDAEVRTVFSDTTGGELLTVVGEITPDAITFLADPDLVDPIPMGARFEIFLETQEKIDKIRFGKVVRYDAPLSNAPSVNLANQMRQFSDTFPTLGLRSNWKNVDGRTSVHNNSALHLPHSVGPNFDALFSRSAIRWDTPLNSNSAKVRVTVIDPNPITISAKYATILCADQRFTTGLAAVMESSLGTNHLRLVTLAGPYSWTDQVTPIVHNVANGDYYTIIYDDITRKLLIYQGDDTTPLRVWPDPLNVVPHGPGYTYVGMAFQASLTPLGPGVQPTGWQAQDGI